MKIFISLVLIVNTVLFFSCTDRSKQLQDEKVVVDSIPKPEKDKYINSIGEMLQPRVKNIISTWSEYKRFEELVTRYYAISASEALSNANELSGLARELKDSIRIKDLETPELRARLNVLNSECLRLKDMSEIPAITDKEVAYKIQAILAAFSALNAKINSVYSISNLENQLALDPDFQAMIQKNPNDSLPIARKEEKQSQNPTQKRVASPKPRPKKKLPTFDRSTLLKKQLESNKQLRLKREKFKKQIPKK